MSAIREFMLGNEDPEEVKEQLVAAGHAEIEFYRKQGVIDGFRQINGIS
jgi:hypothetical protein